MLERKAYWCIVQDEFGFLHTSALPVYLKRPVYGEKVTILALDLGGVLFEVEGDLVSYVRIYNLKKRRFYDASLLRGRSRS